MTVVAWPIASSLSTPFVDIAGRVHDNHDRGLLGITVHPDFPIKPYVYLLYTHDPAGVYPDAQRPMYFVGIDNARFRRPVEPGDQLILKATLTRSMRGIWKFSTVAEGYRWSPLAIAAAFLAIGGMIGALRREKEVVAPPDAA